MRQVGERGGGGFGLAREGAKNEVVLVFHSPGATEAASRFGFLERESPGLRSRAVVTSWVCKGEKDERKRERR